MQVARYRRIRSQFHMLAVTVVLGASVLAFAVTSIARADSQAPWHPLAAAYRTMMFLGDLKPVPWSKIRAAYNKPNPAAAGKISAGDKLIELDAETGDTAKSAIAEAIEVQDRHALYAATTRAVSAAIRVHLGKAEAALGQPKEARKHLLSAREIYRAYEDFVRQADPNGHLRIETAWRTLTGTTGSGDIPDIDPQHYRAASKAIEDYLSANFEPDTFTKRAKLTPLPETIVATKGSVEIAPWLPPGSNLNDQDPLPKLVLNFEQQGIDETDLPMISYGDMLFDSPQIFGDPAKSLGIACSTCHNRGDVNRSLFIPGISHQAGTVDVDGEFFNARFNDRRDDGIDTPSLRGLRFTGPFGRDGRFGSLRDFTRNVIVNEFAGPEPTPFMLDALVSYMLEFDFLPNGKITGDGRLTDQASEAAHRGEKIFRRPFPQMQGRSCASCHVPSANFLDRLAHDIGSQTRSYPNSHSAAYDTPTLLGVKFNAPYFHDGSLPTLASVVDWFNFRYALGLTGEERADLTAYVEAVGDADEPYEVYAGTHTPFRLAFEDLTTFASTLDMLLPDRDAFHAKLMIDTVAPGLTADAAGMDNLAARPKVQELAEILREVGSAIDAEDWAEAERRWAAFKTLQNEYDAAMY